MTGTTMFHRSDAAAPDGRRGAAAAALAALTTLALLGTGALQAPSAHAAQDAAGAEAVSAVAAGDQVVGADTTWRYLDDNTDPAAGETDRTAWTEPGFDDAAWQTGTPGFGAVNGTASGIGGDSSIETLLSYWITQDPKKVVPAYFFRTTVTLDAATLEGATGLAGTLVYDDAATVYVNGERVAGWGDDMITQNLQYQGVSGARDPLREHLVIPADLLVEGENTIAVEIHQCNDTSSDVFFSLELATTDSAAPTPFPSGVLGLEYASDSTPRAPGDEDWFTWMLRGFADLRDDHPEILSPNEPGEPTSANDLGSLARNNAYEAGDAQVERALTDGRGSPYTTMADGLGSELGPLYLDALDAGELPRTKALLSGRVEESVGDHEPAKAAYNYKRPFARMGFTADGGHVNAFESSGSYEGLRNNGSFPSGHTNHGYAQGTILATLLPELAPQILARASEYGDNRLVLGFHYPLDVMGGRMTGQNIAQLRWSDPEFRELLEQSRTELVDVLEDECGDVLAVCVSDQEQYLPTDAALDVYADRMTYGFPTVGATGREIDVPDGAEDLLRTAFPDLTGDQRRLVLGATAIDSGYALDTAGAGEWQRIDLAAAMAADVTVNEDGTLTVDGDVVGEPTQPGDAPYVAADPLTVESDAEGGVDGAVTLTLSNGARFAADAGTDLVTSGGASVVGLPEGVDASVTVQSETAAVVAVTGSTTVDARFHVVLADSALADDVVASSLQGYGISAHAPLQLSATEAARTTLSDLVDDASGVVEGNYSSASFAAFSAALGRAQDMLSDDDAATTYLQFAADRLQSAIDGLDIAGGGLRILQAEESEAWSGGDLSNEANSSSGNLGGVRSGSWIQYGDMTFDGDALPSYLTLSYATSFASGEEPSTLVVHGGDVSGPVVATVDLDGTGAWASYRDVTTELDDAQALADAGVVTFEFRTVEGRDWVGNFDWFTFSENDPAAEPRVTVESEDWTQSSGGGLKNESSTWTSGPVTNVGGTADGDWLAYGEIDLGSAALDQLSVHYVHNSSRSGENSALEVYLDELDPQDPGDPFARVALPTTGSSWTEDGTATIDLPEPVRGTHELFVRLTTEAYDGHPYVANLDSMTFFADVETGPVDTTALAAVVADVEDLEGEGGRYNRIDFGVFTRELEAARALLEADDATQEQVDEQERRLRLAAEQLVPTGEDVELVTVDVSPRCLAGTPYVAVRATNTSDGPVDVGLVTDVGSRAFDDVAAGANAYQSFRVRDAEGDVSVAVTAGTGQDTQTVTEEVAVPAC
ncbi:carbohydrate-binding protein [Cellulosimicrobium arenosum]|uniref:Carbohydrate-binding protein n=1 Tax=Cellulosimicrobium arenosum TaxID=2708133 RepID=A0A927J1Y0_9MICO|nr:carbohydrate-binding protein [Cellulosimicrobium arenosum]MBD8080424.1 carbohydrate-binding protein [Cellulosimicrobium arenosum]